MSPDPSAWRADAQRLAPYARASLERAEGLARRLHSEELAPEHWLAALLADEECGATRIVLHAFADPATIGAEILALCPGIMVVGSGHTLPFSVTALDALRATRARADQRAETTVEPEDLCLCAGSALPNAARERLTALAGARPAALWLAEPPSGAATAEPAGSLFHTYSPTALRALGASARAASSLARSAIAPAHLLLGCLEADGELRTRTGLTAPRARLVLAGLDEDLTPLPARPLGASVGLVEMLRALPERSDSSAALGWFLSSGSAEVVALLKRQKVTLPLWERCHGVFSDP
jgi:hypothetical protein